MTGVVSAHQSTTVRLGARRGVVFATGGFAHDAGKAQTYLRGPIFGTGSRRPAPATSSTSPWAWAPAGQHDQCVVVPGRGGFGRADRGPGRHVQPRLRSLRRQHADRQQPRRAGRGREGDVQRAHPVAFRHGRLDMAEPGAGHDLGRGGRHRPHPVAVARRCSPPRPRAPVAHEGRQLGGTDGVGGSAPPVAAGPAGHLGPYRPRGGSGA